MILVGSGALALRIPIGRTPVDFDFIGSLPEYYHWYKENKHKIKLDHIEEVGDFKFIIRGNPNIEWEISQSGGSSQLLTELVENDPETLTTPFGLVPNLDLLFTIKASHRFLKNSPHFWKTAADYHGMKAAGAKIRPEYREFYELRQKETYTYKHPKLNVSKEQFFDGDGVKYVWDHDDIHQSVKLGDKPAYTYYLKDGSPVDCDKEKFFSVPEYIRIWGVIEEAAVLSVERALVPHPGQDPKKTWQFALSKVCSSITSGWFREYAYENILTVLKNYPDGYWEKFQRDCSAGLVKPFK